MKTGKCRLCLEETKLCKSHILPEFLYTGIYDNDHKYYEFTGTEDVQNRKRRKGTWEHLLCRECERKIKKYEDYSKEVLFSNPDISFPSSSGHVVINRIDYSKFKLFELSILWRASIFKSP